MRASAWKLTAQRTALGTAGALLLAGCSSIEKDPGNEMDQGQATTASTTATSTTETPAQKAPARKDPAQSGSAQPLGTPSLEDRTRYPESGSQLVPTAIRTAHHSGTDGAFDRVTIEFQGTGPAGWYTRWTDQPAQQASGHPIPFEGATALDLGIEMTPYPIDDPAAQAEMLETQPYPGTTNHGGIITGVNYVNAFEARSQFIIGLTQQAPYSLTYLDGPPRVVIDFQTS